jgi:hypothetical protein
MVDLTEELRKPPKVNGIVMAIGTGLCAVVATVVGLIFGAWAVLQPYPEPTVGPMSLYVVAAAGFCLAAGRKIGLRTSIMKRGYSDPGWITPIILVVLAAGCMGIWMASLAATGHTPEASAKNSVATGVTLQPPLTPAQQKVVSSSCASGDYRQCALEDVSKANDRIGDYRLIKLLCQGYKDVPKCSRAIWSTLGSKYIAQRNARSDCQNADADAAQIPGADPKDPTLHCSPEMMAFLASSPTTPTGEPGGF